MHLQLSDHTICKERYQVHCVSLDVLSGSCKRAFVIVMMILKCRNIDMNMMMQ